MEYGVDTHTHTHQIHDMYIYIDIYIYIYIYIYINRILYRRGYTSLQINNLQLYNLKLKFLLILYASYSTSCIS